MPFETFVALRYMRGKRKNRFVSLITIISIAGVSVGVIALIVVMSVMTGFDNALRATIIGNRSHLTASLRTAHTIDDPQVMIDRIKEAAPEVIGAGPIIEMEALLQRRGGSAGAFVMGIDPALEQGVTDIARNLTREGGRNHGAGTLPGEKQIVLGYRLAQRLNARIGSEIGVLTQRTAPTALGMRQGKAVYLTVSGISEAQMSEFDQLYAWVDIPTAQMLTGKDGVDGIHLKLTDAFYADIAATKIESALPVNCNTWYESQQDYFAALKQEKLAMFIILVFIVLVAAFNITSTLIMIVMEKRRDIGILRTLGASARSILLLFVVQGLLIGLGGTLLGVVAGTLLAYYINPVAEFIAWIFGVDLFNSTIYYLDEIPVDVVPWDVTWVTISAVCLTFLSTLYPAWSASRLNPVDALRSE